MTTDPLAQAVMVAYCGWDPTVLVQDGVETLDGNGTTLLTLPSLHVTAVTSVVVTDLRGVTRTYTSADDPATIGPGRTAVGWSGNGTLTYKGTDFCGVWPEDTGNVTVTYSGGYDAPPDDLAAALTSLGKRTSDATGATSKKLGSALLTYAAQIAAGGLLLTEQMVFDRYRLVRAR